MLFLCSHKDITRQKLHEQKAALVHQQQQLLHSQQASDQQVTQTAATTTTATDTTTGGAQDQDNRDQQQRAVANQVPNQQPQQHLSDLGDQQALISLDEFKLDELPNASGDLFGQSGDQDGEFDPYDDDDDDDQEHKHDKNTASQYSRRRSRAVLYQLSGHYGYRRSVNMKSKLKLNNVSNCFAFAIGGQLRAGSGASGACCCTLLPPSSSLPVMEWICAQRSS